MGTVFFTHSVFRVKRRRRWLISKSSFSRQCVRHIRDTCSQLTWKSHSPHTHGGTFWPTLTSAQTFYLHESCQNKPKSEVWKMATSPFDISVASSSVVFMIHAASWHETDTQTHTLTLSITLLLYSLSTNLSWMSHKQPCTHQAAALNVSQTTLYSPGCGS